MKKLIFAKDGPRVIQINPSNPGSGYYAYYKKYVDSYKRNVDGEKQKVGGHYQRYKRSLRQIRKRGVNIDSERQFIKDANPNVVAERLEN
jgi:hypothetical protein